MKVDSLDASVAAAHEAVETHELPRPDVFVLSATGAPAWRTELEEARTLPLGELGSAVPPPWRAVELWTGRTEGLVLWGLDDVAGEPVASAGDPAWWPAFGVWLARRAGAALCLHTSAGCATPRDGEPLPRGGFAVLTDHIDLSGRSPLIGLGESALGPLFPDQSRVHHPGLRAAALEVAATLGFDAHPAVAACLAGPMLETPAEQRMLARLGTDVSVQALAQPLIACAHAGLPCVALVALASEASAPTDGVALLLRRAQEQAPQLERWVRALLPHVARLRDELAHEGGA